MKNIPKPERNWTYKESEFYLLAEQGRFEEAIDLISKIQVDYDPKILLLKLQCYLRSGKAYEALQIAVELENDGINLPQLSMLKGECLYNLKEYESALIIFKKCYEEENTPEIGRWVQKCEVHLTDDGETQAMDVFDFSPPLTDFSEEEEYDDPIINYDYFQTNTHIILFIDVVGAKKNSYAQFHNKSVDVYVDIYDVKLHFQLYGEIDPSQSSFTIGPYSIECKLLKAAPGDWERFEEKHVCDYE